MWQAPSVVNECECNTYAEAGESTFPGAISNTCRPQPLLLGGAGTPQVKGKQSPALLGTVF